MIPRGTLERNEAEYYVYYITVYGIIYLRIVLLPRNKTA